MLNSLTSSTSQFFILERIIALFNTWHSKAQVWFKRYIGLNTFITSPPMIPKLLDNCFATDSVYSVDYILFQCFIACRSYICTEFRPLVRIQGICCLCFTVLLKIFFFFVCWNNDHIIYHITKRSVGLIHKISLINTPLYHLLWYVSRQLGFHCCFNICPVDNSLL